MESVNPSKSKITTLKLSSLTVYRQFVSDLVGTSKVRFFKMGLIYSTKKLKKMCSSAYCNKSSKKLEIQT